MRCAWVALIIKSVAAIICRVDNAAFIENVGRCKKILLFVCLCCCEFQRFNNFFCCHGLSLSFLLFHPGKPVIIGDKPRRGGGGPCRLVGVADRPFLFCFNRSFASDLQTAACRGFARAIPFYAACIWSTRSSHRPGSIVPERFPLSPGSVGGVNHC